MTDLLETPHQTSDIVPTIHQHPTEILAGLSLLAASEAYPDDGKLLVALAKNALAGAAEVEHALALMISEETGGEAEVPSAVVYPNIIGPETIYHFVRARKEAGRGIRPHPQDETKHLIYPLV